MPRPPPMSRHELRSFTVACASRGYQSKGTAIVRPSDNSTDSRSRDTCKLVALATMTSAVEELIPRLQEMLLMLDDYCLDSSDLIGTKPMTALQLHGFEPELGLQVVAFDMNMRRFTTVTGIKEEY